MIMIKIKIMITNTRTLAPGGVLQQKSGRTFRETPEYPKIPPLIFLPSGLKNTNLRQFQIN